MCVPFFIAAASKSHTSRISLPPFTASLFLDACCRLNALKCILENLGDNRARYTAPMLIIYMHPIQLTVRTCATREAARETCASLAAWQVYFLHDIYIYCIYMHTHTHTYIYMQETQCVSAADNMWNKYNMLSNQLHSLSAKFVQNLCHHCPLTMISVPIVSLNSPGMTRVRPLRLLFAVFLSSKPWAQAAVWHHPLLTSQRAHSHCLSGVT